MSGNNSGPFGRRNRVFMRSMNPSPGAIRSCKDGSDRVNLFNARQALVKTLVPDGETAVIDTHTVENGGIELVEMHRIFCDIIAEIIGFAVGHSGLDPSPGHPHAEVARVMVSTVALPGQFSLAVGGTPEFSTEDNKCVLKHSPFLQVLDQGCGWLIYIKTLILDFLGQVAVLIPAPVKDLNDSNPSFNESTGEERRVGKGAGLLRVGPYISRVALLSPFKSVSSGTLLCIRNAISYWAILV